MSVTWFDGMLANSEDAGIYFLPEPDVDELLEAAAVSRFPCLRVNLRGCEGKADLLLRLGGALEFPPHVARTWDALGAALGDMRRPGLPGQVFLLEHSEQLRADAREDFKTAMEVLQAASVEWAAHGQPLWSFIVLEESEFDALP
jgi:hypothetical protein